MLFEFQISTKDMDVNQKEFEDTKGAIRILISKKNRQHNGQKKKYKRTNTRNYKNMKKSKFS
jgi:hypothetical protein